MIVLNIKKLKSLRENNNLSQNDMADILNINRITYMFIEQGKNEPDN